MEGEVTGDQSSSFATENGSSDDEANDSGPSGASATSSASSSASSPLPVDNLGPIFEVQGARSSPESMVLTFKVQRLDDPESREPWEVTRNYEDLENFNSLLTGGQKFEGIIYPPLPPPISSKLFADGFTENAFIHRKQVERYLQMVCSHPILGRTQALADFLSPSFASQKGRSGRKGILAKFAESFMGPQKLPTRDVEDFFQNERDWSTSYGARLKIVLESLQAVIHAEKKIAGQLKHLCTALSMNAPSSVEVGLVNNPSVFLNNQLQSKMASAFLNIQDLMEEGMQRGLCDFFCTYDLYGQYIQSEQVMLNRRTALLVDYENANRNWDKAKAHKKDEAEVGKKSAESAFEECSDTARHEIKAFQKQRVQEMRTSMTQLARNELARARQIQAALRRTIDQACLFPVPT